MKRIYTFYCDLTADDFLQRVKDSVQNNTDYMFEETSNGFYLGVLRGGHSGGYWYNCLITNESEKLKLSGPIEYKDPYSDSIIQNIEEILVYVLFFFITVPVLITNFIQNKIVKEQSNEEKSLERFMIDIMKCYYKQ